MLFTPTPQIDLLTHPLFVRLTTEHQFQVLTPENFTDVAKKEGTTLLLFIENPNRMKETMDALVITPELVSVFPTIKNKAVVIPPESRKLAIQYGFKRWPAIVLLRDGRYLGAVDGLRLWSELLSETNSILQSQPKYPPSIGIDVRAV